MFFHQTVVHPIVLSSNRFWTKNSNFHNFLTFKRIYDSNYITLRSRINHSVFCWSWKYETVLSSFIVIQTFSHALSPSYNRYCCSRSSSASAQLSSWWIEDVKQFPIPQWNMTWQQHLALMFSKHHLIWLQSLRIVKCSREHSNNNERNRDHQEDVIWSEMRAAQIVLSHPQYLNGRAVLDREKSFFLWFKHSHQDQQHFIQWGMTIYRKTRKAN